MSFFSRKCLPYGIGFSLLFHSLLLFGGFFHLPSEEQKERFFKITTVLPASEKLADINRFSRSDKSLNHQGKNNLNSQNSGDNGDSSETEMIYTEMIRQKILSNLVYPLGARKNGIEGKVYVRFSIDRFGNLIFAEISKSSGFSLLDDSAMMAIRNSSPFPQIPEIIGKESLCFVQPLTFTLKE
ncbi:MAG TPA: energy transducer TonB [Spirochaetota bacterium]|nr:energy transducer TonB [Spirochaetota bacterium]HON17088.1 energy transducer TonB [Spirochaetota bacterium]HRU65987.1 energy transducer TonB [Spirochaetota bacterium]